MKIKIISTFWGLLLIAGGVLLLTNNLGYLEDLEAPIWIAIFSGFSLLFLISYLLSGIGAWGWLFPTLITAGLAVTIGLAEAGVHSSVVGMPILASLGLCFVAPYLMDRQKNWWALIPLWVFAVLTAIVGLADRVQGEWIGTLVLFSISLPFLVVYLTDRTRKWALIPAFILAVVGLIPLMATSTRGEMIGAFVLLAVATPFFVVYFMSERNWWALIPAGITASIALEVAVIGFDAFPLGRTALPAVIMFLGWAATFGVLWLRRTSQPTQWAAYPAVIFAILAGLSLLGSLGMTWWPLALVAIGIWLMARALWPRKV